MGSTTKKRIEQNRDYWRKRAEYNFEHQEELQESYYERLDKLYEGIQEDLETDYSKIVAKYASNNGFTLEEGRKQLSKKELTEYKSDVYKYLEEVKNSDGSPEYTKYLINQSLKHRATVIDVLKTNWRNTINNLSNPEQEQELLSQIYMDTLLKSRFDLEKGMNSQLNFTRVNENLVKEVLNDTFAGGNFSERYWQDKDKLAKALDSILIRGLASGKSYDKMARDIAKATDSSKKRSQTLVRTEGTRITSQSNLKNMVDSGVRKFEFIATLDNKTSNICSSMDGMIFNIEDAEIGVNVPPLHPNCRSTIAPYIEDFDDLEYDERAERDLITGKTEIIRSADKLTYSDWAGIRIGKNAQEKIEKNKETLKDLLNYVNATAGKEPEKVSVPKSSIYECEAIMRDETPEEIANNPMYKVSTTDENGSEQMAEIIKQLNYNKLPRKVSREEYEETLKNNEVGEMFRGVKDLPDKTVEEMKHDFYKGEFFAGKGIYGNGTYTFYGEKNKRFALEYTNKNNEKDIINCTLSKNAKIIEFTTLEEMIRADKSTQFTRANELYKAKGMEYGSAFLNKTNSILSEPGAYASLLGYDAIRVENKNILVILNRGEVVYCDE